MKWVIKRILSKINIVPCVTRKFIYFYPRTGLYFRMCEDGAGWHLIPCRISPRSEFFSQAYYFFSGILFSGIL